MNTPSRPASTSQGSEGTGPASSRDPRTGNGGWANRHGVGFQLVVEPDGINWIEVRRSDGELIDLQRLGDEAVDVDEFADSWLGDALREVEPLERCVECGLAVELLDERYSPTRHMRHAAEYRLAAWVDAVDDAFFQDVVLCLDCRSQLLRRYGWLRPLLGQPPRPWRAR